jgi:hypothetical protein
VEPRRKLVGSRRVREGHRDAVRGQLAESDEMHRPNTVHNLWRPPLYCPFVLRQRTRCLPLTCKGFFFLKRLTCKVSRRLAGRYYPGQATRFTTCVYWYFHQLCIFLFLSPYIACVKEKLEMKMHKFTACYLRVSRSIHPVDRYWTCTPL